MIYQNLMFHNVSYVESVEGKEGVKLYRFSKRARDGMYEGTRAVDHCPAGVEIRFIPSNDNPTVKLYNYKNTENISIYLGDYQLSQHFFEMGPIELKIEINETYVAYKDLLNKVGEYTYHPNMVRIIFWGTESDIHFISADGVKCPPNDNMLPKKSILTYGTSITHGYSSNSPVLSYAYQVAWRLKMQLINLGLSGNAFLEPSIAEFIADRNDWDVALFCISVNMYAAGVSTKEFYDAAYNFIKIIKEKHPKKSVFCMSMLTFHKDMGVKHPRYSMTTTSNEYRNALKAVADDLKFDNLYYIDGLKMLHQTGLSADLIHPGVLGMIKIGENVSEIIENIE
jgi:hypothetical protein